MLVQRRRRYHRPGSPSLPGNVMLTYGASAAKQWAPIVLSAAALAGCVACGVVAAVLTVDSTVRTCISDPISAACGVGVVSSALAVSGAGYAVRGQNLAMRAAEGSGRLAQSMQGSSMVATAASASLGTVGLVWDAGNMPR